MRRSILWLFCAPLVSACAAPGVTERDATSPRNLGAEVETFLAHYVRTLETGNENAVRALFVDDGRFAWFTDGALSYRSPDDVVAGLRQLNGAWTTTELTAIRVLPLSSPFVTASAQFRTQLSLPGNQQHEFGGVITWLLERGQDATAWRVVTGHTSTPAGPPGAGAKPSASEGWTAGGDRRCAGKDRLRAYGSWSTAASSR